MGPWQRKRPQRRHQRQAVAQNEDAGLEARQERVESGGPLDRVLHLDGVRSAACGAHPSREHARADGVGERRDAAAIVVHAMLVQLFKLRNKRVFARLQAPDRSQGALGLWDVLRRARAQEAGDVGQRDGRLARRPRHGFFRVRSGTRQKRTPLPAS